MERLTIRNYLKAIGISLKSIFKSTKVLPLIQVILVIGSSTLPFISLRVLNTILDDLSKPIIDTRVVIYETVGLVVISASGILFSSILSIVKNKIERKIEISSKRTFYKKYLQLPMGFLDSPHGRDVCETARVELTGVYGLFDIVLELVSCLYAFVIAASILIEYSLGWAVFLVLSMLPGIISKFRETSFFDKYEYNNQAQKRYHSYYRQLLTNREYSNDVRMYDLTDDIKTRYFDLHKKYMEERKTMKLGFLKVRGLYDTITIVGLSVFLVSLIISKSSNRISIGDLVMFFGIASTYVDNTRYIANDVDNSLCFARWLQPVIEFFYHQEESDKGICEVDDFFSLEFVGVSFKYSNSENYVLKDISFTINSGDKIAIVGENGSGKTTIIKLMIGLYPVYSGAILLNGRNIQEFRIESVRRLFSVLFQDYPRYPLTLRENIALSNINQIDDENIRATLSDVQMGQLKGYLDCYLSRSLDETGIELSGGQWQRIAAARAVYKNAPIVVFDEPSSSLDAEAEEQLFRLYEKLDTNKTSIMITHHISGVKNANKIIVLKDGKIDDIGSHTDLISRGGLYGKMYEMQKARYNSK